MYHTSAAASVAGRLLPDAGVLLPSSRLSVRSSGSSMPFTSHRPPRQGTVFSPDKATGCVPSQPLARWPDVAKEAFQARPAGAGGGGWPRLAGAGRAIPMSWQRVWGAALAPRSAVRGDSPLVPRKVVIFGPSVLRLCLDSLTPAAEAQEPPVGHVEGQRVRPHVLKTQGWVCREGHWLRGECWAMEGRLPSPGGFVSPRSQLQAAWPLRTPEPHALGC